MTKEEKKIEEKVTLNAEGLKEQFYQQIRDQKCKASEVGPDFVKSIMKSFYEALLQAEMTEHLGYEKHALAGRNSGNSRNGTSTKNIRGNFGEVEIAIPRDRNSEFEPQVIKKHESNVAGFSEKIISLYARGMTTREIEAHLKEIYDIDVSPAFISRAVDKVSEEVIAWQNRPLEALYAVLYLDGIRFNVRDNTSVKNMVVYVALGVNMLGQQEVLGLWCSENEGASFWMNVCTELKARGVQDILIACVDGLLGLPEAIQAAFPRADVQLCIVHQIRNSTRFIASKDRKNFCSDLKEVYTAPTAQAAEAALDRLEQLWGSKYPASIKCWRDNWPRLIPFFKYPPELRRIIYTTNSIEALNAYLRKNTKNRRLFPNVDSLMKILILNVKNLTDRWKFRQGWNIIANQLTCLFGDRVKLDALSYGPGELKNYSRLTAPLTQN